MFRHKRRNVPSVHDAGQCVSFSQGRPSFWLSGLLEENTSLKILHCSKIAMTSRRDTYGSCCFSLWCTRHATLHVALRFWLFRHNSRASSMDSACARWIVPYGALPSVSTRTLTEGQKHSSLRPGVDPTFGVCVGGGSRKKLCWNDCLKSRWGVLGRNNMLWGKGKTITLFSEWLPHKGVSYLGHWRKLRTPQSLDALLLVFPVNKPISTKLH